MRSGNSEFMGIQEEIGRTFAEARREKGFSVEDVSGMTRMHPDVIGDIEGGVLDRLGRLYMKGFIKKYSRALDLDEAEMLRRYEKAVASIPAKEFVFEEEKSGNRISTHGIFSGITKREMQMAAAAILAVVIVIMIFVLSGRIRSGVIRAREEKMAEASRSAPVRIGTKQVEKKVLSPAPVAEGKKIIPVPEKKKTVPVTEKKPAAKVELTLRAADDEVWVDVASSGKRIFVGILKPGKSVMLTSDEPITVISGRSEDLEFTLNGHNLGTVAAGVVKDIKVFPSGVKVGSEWVKRVE
jgi:cytoskeletal protein RodZ